MITFVTLFLGLVLGAHTVELAVSEEVARAEIHLDGRWVADLDGPPWTARCDFGPELLPHELVAVAFDEEGREIDRVRQKINLARAPAEVGIVLEGGREGRNRTARLNWESFLTAEPLKVTVTFDGRPLAPSGTGLFPLPPHDPAQLHLLRAEVDFTETVSSVAEVIFGGTYADEVASELTAVPVRLGDGELPPPAALAGWLLARSRPLEVVSVEAAEAEVVVVRDEAARAPLLRMEGHLRRLVTALQPLDRPPGGDRMRFAMRLAEDHQLQMLWPVPEFHRGSADRRYAIFPGSSTFPSRDVGIYWLLTRVQQEGAGRADQQLADAVAVAGMAAAGKKRRRAVLLVLGRDPADASQLMPAIARRYLEHLHVPLFVWAVERKPAAAVAAWGEVSDVSSPARLEAAVRALSAELERQRILWVPGIHLPQQITLSTAATGAGVQLVR